MSLFAALDRLLVPVDATIHERVLCWVIYVSATVCALGGLWVYVSAVMEVLGPIRLRVRWPRQVRRAWRPFRELGAALLVPFRSVR